MKKLLNTLFEDKGHYVTVADKKYSVYFDQTSSVVYFFDVSSEYEATVGLVTTRPVIGIISVDNYDDLEDVISDSDISNINSFIANFVKSLQLITICFTDVWGWIVSICLQTTRS